MDATLITTDVWLHLSVNMLFAKVEMLEALVSDSRFGRGSLCVDFRPVSASSLQILEFSSTIQRLAGLQV